MKLPLLDRALDGLDAARTLLYRSTGRSETVRWLARRRASRLLVVSALLVTIHFLLALWIPLFLLLVSPILLGFPHLVSEVRYLMPRAGDGPIPRRSVRPMAALFALSVAAALLKRPGSAAIAALAGTAVVGLRAAATPGRRALLVALGAGGIAVAVRWPALVPLAFIQGHNIIALALAAWLVRREVRAGWLPLALFALAMCAIGMGAVDPLLARAAALPGASGALRDFIGITAPAGVDWTRGLRWVAAFAFAQSLHYSIWLHVVPDASRTGQRPRSFRRSFELLRRDLGAIGTTIAFAGTAGVPLLALASAERARTFYVGLAAYHGFLELAFIVAAAIGPGVAKRSASAPPTARPALAA